MNRGIILMFEIEWLTQIFPNYKVEAKHKKNTVDVVSTDSRVLESNSLFIPLVGDRFDGHNHVDEAIKRGAKAIIWNKDKPTGDIPADISLLFVEDTLKALQLLAAEYRKLVNPKVIGITGSNGKTTTKDLLEATLNQTYITTATKGNFNNHIGLPLTILNMKKNTEVLILEMGMNNFGEIELLSEIAKPDIAIITNIGESHIEHLGSREGIKQAKLEIVKPMTKDSVLIIDGDEPLLAEINYPGKVITCGFSEANQQVISHIKLTPSSTTFNVNEAYYEIPLLGNHHAKNATFVIEVAKLLKVSDEKVRAGLTKINLTHMRFELITGKNNATLINDAYNASPTSIKASIEVVEKLDGYQKKILVLGDILELGLDYKKYYLDISKKVNGMQTIDEVYTYGETAELITDYLNLNSVIIAEHFSKKELLVEKLEKQMLENSLIFFKASRGIKLEDIIEQLKEGNK